MAIKLTLNPTFSALATLKPQAAGFAPTLREGTEGVATIPTRTDAMETEVCALPLWLAILRVSRRVYQ